MTSGTIEVDRPALAHRILYLDGWRGLAIAGVLVDHFVSSSFLNAGRLGVELFFVLSGRLMAQILFIDRTPLGKFYFRRFSRLWPSLAVYCAVIAAYTFKHPHFIHNHFAVLSALTYTFNYAYFFGLNASPISHTWSLCIEEHSYIVLGLIAFLCRKRLPLALAAIAALAAFCVVDGIMSTYLLKQDYYHVYWRSDVRAASILMGAMAYLITVQNQMPRFLAYGSATLFLIIGVALNANVVPDPIKYSVGTSSLALCICTMQREARLMRFLSQRGLVWFGTVSYSIYLWQQPFGTSLPHEPLLKLFRLALALTVGIIAFYVIETPTRKWLNERPPSWAKG